MIRSLEIIGEAASKLSIELKDRHEMIDWRGIINMRHRLIHSYGDVALDIVWYVTTSELQPVIDILAPLIPPIDAT